MIPHYPQTSAIQMTMRPYLHPLLQKLPEGLSEFTFSNLYLFRKTHKYKITTVESDLIVITGEDQGDSFFMLPFGFPSSTTVEKLFDLYGNLKCLSVDQARYLRDIGYCTYEDRDNFDYLYLRKDMAELTSGKFHKKRNLIKAFLSSYPYTGEPLLERHVEDALDILEQWKNGREDPGDYEAAKEALEKAEQLQLCGGLYYVYGKPVAYSLGEELACGETFVIHFEKAVQDFKGLWQFVNQAFASILPEKYITINREQDLGASGMRKAKLSYNPVAFVKKYRAVKSKGR